MFPFALNLEPPISIFEVRTSIPVADTTKNCPLLRTSQVVAGRTLGKYLVSAVTTLAEPEIMMTNMRTAINVSDTLFIGEAVTKTAFPLLKKVIKYCLSL